MAGYCRRTALEMKLIGNWAIKPAHLYLLYAGLTGWSEAPGRSAATTACFACRCLELVRLRLRYKHSDLRPVYAGICSDVRRATEALQMRGGASTGRLCAVTASSARCLPMMRTAAARLPCSRVCRPTASMQPCCWASDVILRPAHAADCGQSRQSACPASLCRIEDCSRLGRRIC